MRYIDQISVGLDFTARDIQQKQKEKGLPWEPAKAFDHSAPIGEFIPLTELSNPVSYTHLRAHETVLDLVCRLLLEKKKQLNYSY